MLTVGASSGRIWASCTRILLEGALQVLSFSSHQDDSEGWAVPYTDVSKMDFFT